MEDQIKGKTNMQERGEVGKLKTGEKIENEITQK